MAVPLTPSGQIGFLSGGTVGVADPAPATNSATSRALWLRS